VDDIAALIGPDLGWSAAQKRASIAEYRDQVDAEVTAVAALINS
jgi:hypothetical protein